MVVSALLAGPAAAVPAPAVEPMGHVGQSYGELLWMSLGLLVAIAVIAVVAMRLFGGGRLWRRGGASGLLEVIARQPLEPRRSLYVVRVGQRRILVGTSELGVTMLTELEAGQGGEREARLARVAHTEREGVPASGSSFADLVKEAARQWTGRRAAAKRAKAREEEAGKEKAREVKVGEGEEIDASEGRGATIGEGAAAIVEERWPS